ncbi:MAG: bifunctional diguanylate cyclase/phosphodiesterase [Lachnospiraceae bacterium]|nr:bifunctional diguanylate cyclase/phosphodiesterase [Lachnospiraceae bacterium]MDE6698741.1 bifunctional diguanylate cyclase/phosphodiesterase [Lachnospiraceae bacterium]
MGWFYLSITVIIIVLIVVLNIYKYKYKQMKGYYKYSKDKAELYENKYEKEKKSLDEELKSLKNIAYTNVTTNIWNIDFFIEKSTELIERSNTKKFTLVAFSISNIGKINQLFGPIEGDNVVYYTAQQLKAVPFWTKYIYAQVYSNLFCFLLENTGTDEVLRTIHDLSEKLINYDANVRIESSYGIYENVDVSKKILDMVSCAQLAMKYVGKDSNYAFYNEELKLSYENNKRMSEEMEQAMENHKFVMFLQPIVDLRSSKIVSAEALVRWDYPGKGMLSPYSFLPVFEGTTLIKKLDYYMWEECCRTIRHWIDNKIEPISIAMNISPAHLQSTAFIDKLNEIMDKYLIKKNQLVLEIPEQGLTKNLDTVKLIMDRLAEEGFSVCIDNFGSVNSPLNLLKDYSIEKIKIDRNFINRNVNSQEGLTILRYLVAMAKELDFTVIAEGIENTEQIQQLVDLGSDLGQGYYFSKPINLREFDELNKSRLSDYYRPDEYYPTFEDYEKDIDLIVQIFENATRYTDFYAS